MTSPPGARLVPALGVGAISQDLLTAGQRETLGAVIQAVKREGSGIGEGTVRDFEGLLRAAEGGGAEVVVLACTELPMVPVGALCEAEGRAAPGLALVDPAVLLAGALLEAASAY